MEATAWIFDYVSSLLRSPSWEASVFDFIDTHCIIFDNDDENKFAYSDLHGQFRQLIESMISNKLAEVGIAAEDFAAACQSDRFGRDVNKAVYEQMIAMDDFLTFKKLMVRRNMELELEAVKALQSASIPISAPSNDEDAHAQFELAVKASSEITTAEKAKLELQMQEEEEAKDSEEKEGAGKEDAAAVDRQLKQAMDANLMEMELFHKQEEFEALQLEQAIAASLALHEDDLRNAQQEAKEEEEEGEEEEEEESDEDEEEQEVEAKESSSTAAAEISNNENEDGDEVAEAKVTQDEVMTAKITSPINSPAQSPKKKSEAQEQEQAEDKNGNDQQQEEKEEEEEDAKPQHNDISDAPVVEAVRAITIEENDINAVPAAATAVTKTETETEKKARKEKKKKEKKEKKERREKKGKRRGSKDNGSDLVGPIGSLNGLQSRPVLGGIKKKSALEREAPSLGEMQEQMAERKKMAEEAFRKNHEMLAEQKMNQAKLQKEAKISEEDMRQRAEHLKQQRDKIIAKKKADREKAVREAEEGEEQKKKEFKKFQLIELKKKEKEEEGGGVGNGKNGNGNEEKDEEQMTADERRQAMRIALAARMKRDMLVAEEERLTKMQHDQFAELDAKLRRVEELRDENRLREDDLKEAIRQNQNLRAMNIHRSKINSLEDEL
ncbi:hypothetical protein ScalyP_jg5450 [Parmales sp. scaly parma]|nr:hypothetical protein ScalyP_jg5450 [Parmales sp. scaly parma]